MRRIYLSSLINMASILLDPSQTTFENGGLTSFIPGSSLCVTLCSGLEQISGDPSEYPSLYVLMKRSRHFRATFESTYRRRRLREDHLVGYSESRSRPEHLLHLRQFRRSFLILYRIFQILSYTQSIAPPPENAHGNLIYSGDLSLVV